ncbi:chymotrypsin inhibitor-like [Ceratitis capitata]|uniref:chymotrypsin inhibitor-like n=1 Tax=Ceratitis capitata TaxID=7213 RepID=UPI000329D4A1|nr:chymotrypsin inhibitor-like [Ceratitis capitata]
MSYKYCLLFLIVVGVAGFASSLPQGSCGENEEFTSCGSACPPPCHDDGKTFCTLQCIVGCQCKRGFLLNQNGKCVLPENC